MPIARIALCHWDILLNYAMHVIMGGADIKMMKDKTKYIRI